MIGADRSQATMLDNFWPQLYTQFKVIPVNSLKTDL